jgi:hypothetical protein
LLCLVSIIPINGGSTFLKEGWWKRAVAEPIGCSAGLAGNIEFIVSIVL